MLSRAALLSFLGLVCIQVTIGLVYSLAGKQGSYAFSQASALTIAECLKFLISASLFLLESPQNSHDYQKLPSSAQDLLTNDTTLFRRWSGIFSILSRANAEVPHTMKAGFAVLACLYAINNHLAFLLFLLADSGTISLIKSGSTFTTALVLLLLTGQNQAGRQWLAIILQVMGLIITQTDLSSFMSNSSVTETLYPLSTYGLLFLAAAITAVSSVANERLCKTTSNNRKISLHGQNMFLYSAGAIINFSIYISKSHSSAGFEEPGFFEGYNTVPAILVLVSNTLIGLAITAVYKYANAIIKCLAQAFATAVLLILGFLLFQAPITMATIPGSVLVFVGTYLYVTHVKPKTEQSDKTTVKDETEVVSTRPTGNQGSIIRVVGIFLVAYSVTISMTFYFSWWALQVHLAEQVAGAATAAR